MLMKEIVTSFKEIFLLEGAIFEVLTPIEN